MIVIVTADVNILHFINKTEIVLDCKSYCVFLFINLVGGLSWGMNS